MLWLAFRSILILDLADYLDIRGELVYFSRKRNAIEYNAYLEKKKKKKIGKRKVGKGADRPSTRTANLTLLSRWCLLQHFYDRLSSSLSVRSQRWNRNLRANILSACRAFTIFCKSNVTLSHGHDHGCPILSSRFFRLEKYAFRRYSNLYSNLFVTILKSLVLGILIGTNIDEYFAAYIVQRRE